MRPLKRLLRKCYSACLGDKSLEFPGFALNVNYGDAGGRSYRKHTSRDNVLLSADKLSRGQRRSCILCGGPTDEEFS
jgi:hypothetical protein